MTDWSAGGRTKLAASAPVQTSNANHLTTQTLHGSSFLPKPPIGKDFKFMVHAPKTLL